MKGCHSEQHPDFACLFGHELDSVFPEVDVGVLCEEKTKDPSFAVTKWHRLCSIVDNHVDNHLQTNYGCIFLRDMLVICSIFHIVLQKSTLNRIPASMGIEMVDYALDWYRTHESQLNFQQFI